MSNTLKRVVIMGTKSQLPTAYKALLARRAQLLQGPQDSDELKMVDKSLFFYDFLKNQGVFEEQKEEQKEEPKEKPLSYPPLNSLSDC